MQDAGDEIATTAQQQQQHPGCPKQSNAGDIPPGSSLPKEAEGLSPGDLQPTYYPGDPGNVPLENAAQLGAVAEAVSLDPLMGADAGDVWPLLQNGVVGGSSPVAQLEASGLQVDSSFGQFQADTPVDTSAEFGLLGQPST